MRIIQLEKHNKKWSKGFVKETAKLNSILSKNLVDAYHIGSTAIAGLLAKPVIDILLEVNSLSEIDKRNSDLEQLGYEVKGEFGIAGRRFFQKGGEQRTHHIHIFETGNPEIERHLLFIEYMNAHPEKIIAYEKLKIELVDKYSKDPIKYSEGKSLFLKAIDTRAVEWKNNKQFSQ